MCKRETFVTVDIDDPSLSRRSRELTMLMELGTVFARAHNLIDLLNDSLAWILRNFSLDAGRIYLLEEDAEGEHLSLAAAKGVETRGSQRMELDQGFTGKSASLRQLIAHKVTHLEDPGRKIFLQGKGLKGMICVPLVANHMVGGVLNLAAKRELSPGSDEINLLILCAHRIAVAILNIKLYAELEEQASILKEQMEMLSFFSNTAYHDLKSPVVGIYGLSQRLLKNHSNNLDVRGVLCVQQIVRAAERLDGLVGEINEFIKARHATRRLEELELSELLSEVRQTYAQAMDARGVAWQEPKSLPRIRAERMGLIRALENLVDNALKYGGKGLSLIKIGVEADQDHLVLSVSDDGAGVAPMDLERIFSPFRRGTTSRGLDGSGLGLAIVSEVARRHRGNAWAASQLGKGATFYISLAK